MTAGHGPRLPPAAGGPHGPTRRGWSRAETTRWLTGLALIAGLLSSHAGWAAPGASLADARLAPELALRAAAGQYPLEAIVDFEPTDFPALRRQLGLSDPDDAPGRQRIGGLRERVRQAREGLRGRLAARTGSRARLRRGFDHIPQALVEIENDEALRALLADPAVRAVMPDHRLEADDLEALTLIGQPTPVNSGVRGDGTAVAVLDTGVLHTHGDFGACSAPGVPASCRVAVSIDIATSDGQLDDPANPHGTNVSAIVANTAPGTDLVVLDVFGATGASSSTIIAAYDWVIANRAAHNIRAVNLSLSVPGIYSASDCGSRFTGFAANGSSLPNQSNPFRLSIDTAASVGITTLSSAGNDGIKNGLPMPACSANAISVGAVYDSAQGSRSWAAGCTDSITAADLVGCFSNSAGILELLAPGATITAGGWSYSGTSQAAPHVAGAWALLASAFPTESITQLRTRLLNGGRPILDALAGITKPRLDLEGVFPPPVNDDFAAAAALSGSQTTVNTSNRFASREPGEPLHAGGGGALSLWWRWTAPGAGRVTLDLAGSGFDTLLGVYTGGTVSALTQIAGNDDAQPGTTTSRVSFPVTVGSAYSIAVDGKAGAWGMVNLALGWVAAAADLSAQLTANPDPVVTGGTLDYRLTVQNAGPDEASAVSALLNLPAGTATGLLPAGCIGGAGSVTCTRATLGSGAQSEWTVPVTVTGTGSLGASLSVSSATNDPMLANNTATRSVQALLPADLSVTVAPATASVPEGADATFTVTVTNAGPAVANAAQLQVLASGLGTATSLPAGCSAIAGGVQCTLGDVAVGQPLALPLGFVSGAPGSASLTAIVSASTLDPHTTNNSAVASITVLAVADLRLEATRVPPQGALVMGERLALTVTVTNEGPSTASGARVALTLPPGLSLVVGPAGCSGTPQPGCELGDIAAGATLVRHLELDTQGATAGDYLIAVAASSVTFDPPPLANAMLPVQLVAAATTGRQVPSMPGIALLLLAGVLLAVVVLADAASRGRPSRR